MDAKKILSIIVFVFSIQLLFSQTWDIGTVSSGNWLSPVSKNFGTQKSFQFGDGTGTDTVWAKQVNTGKFIIGGNATNPGEVQFRELSGNGANWTVLKAATSITTNIGVTLWSSLPSTSEMVILGSTGLLSTQTIPTGGFTMTEKSANYTAVNGDYVVFISTSNDTLTLPASPSANDKVGVSIESITDSFIVVINRNGSLINNIAANVTLYLAGDALTLQYTTGNWVPIANGIQRHSAIMNRAAAQSIGSGSFVKIDFDTEETGDYGNLAYIACDCFKIRRSGRYTITLSGILSPATVLANYNQYIYKNGVTLREGNTTTNTTSGGGMYASTEDFVAGDIIQYYLFQNGTGAVNTNTDTRRMRMAIKEE